MTDKAVGAAGSPTSAASFAPPVMRDPAPQVSSEAVDVSTTPAVAPRQQQSPKSASGSGSRKRVFTFQKRWLHSLPIVERSLPETEMDGRVLKAVRTAGGASAAAAVTAAAAAGADNQKDVIVCMLCDDPASKRELTKVWSRLNCRRGRIENHLLSKHPEFMRLLKHKREAEGDLAVQIFLQNLREGRCNARTEVNNGLYSQLTIGAAARSSPVAAGTTTDSVELQKRALGEYMNVRDELESSRKRAKLSGSPANAKDTAVMAASAYSAGGMLIRSNGTEAGVDGLASSVLYQDAMSAQWQTVFFNKLVVVTGGDNKAMTSVATQLWLLGANVLLTFSNMSALDEFNTKHIGRFPDPSEGEESPRGVMLPVLGSFRTQKSIAEWCGSIATKYQRVDFLINYAGSEVVEALNAGEKPRDPSEEPGIIASSPALIEALSESMSSTCFPDPAASESGWLSPSTGTIVNIASALDDAAVEPLIKSLAAKLQPRNVQVNCVLLPPQSDATDVEIPHDTATLSHTILFLLSPSSRLLSGSVLRVQKDKTASERRADVPSAAEAADVINSHSI
ncbi:hypothetical protein F441_03761 [Phytophthora nicotianae CJ01A1]|uniref:Uncharacterized protein n=6 Tax=Phytophthora nicotianae TaxID=4792 RepID=W2QLZ7_PHYN3|nr:hypothetical protein PPTG_08614 [Phytophthora nicotianae INRA-310]ETI53245.1 hypothetical protein F443_03777 [Phytophthora nicotianae P1569]ETK93079.1 hypothetical protein L915_03674 [Phytophthora nicotianae]ETO81891.1 hypothetical protein F444_03859 [Phytophthora nicotianae P1976]ETP23049.1 hypothetical protein F441_03761 [Phytophthora nicotianae CJ01A1]ETP51034.1 hypothetical protein F442_03762 [Phytophthora nicotianae P10297]